MRRSLVWALGLTVFFACSSDDDPADPGPNPGADGGTISGTVVDLNGDGVEGATVSADGPSEPTATTSGDGGYTLDDLEPGDYTVSVEAPAGYVIALGASESATTELAAAATATVDFRVATEEDGDVFVVTLQGVTFEPSDVTIAEGQRIRWLNVDGSHTVTPDGHDEWEEEAMNSEGKTFEHRFESAGEFDYFCQPHFDQGMTGIIRVDN